MRALRSPALVAGVISTVVAPLATAAYVWANHGFGEGDLPVFALWSLGLGVLVSAVLPLSYVRAIRRLRGVRALLGAVWGAVTGVLFAYALAFGMGPWIRAFSFPILYIWAGAAALGSAIGVQFVTSEHVEAQRRRKLWMSVGVALGVLLITAAAPLGLMLGGIYVWDRAESEIHLLPAGFTGPVVILFGQAEGATPAREGRARLYKIPASGVLRTQFPDNPGWSAPKYYYVDADGKRSPIVAGAPCDDSLAGDPVEACLEGTLSIGGRATPPYSAYVVGRRRDRAIAERRVDSLVRTVVYGERVTSAP